MAKNRRTRLAKEGVWIVSGNIFSIFGTLVLIRLLTEHLQPAQFGQLALGLTLVVLINQVVTGGIAAGIARYYVIALNKNELRQYLLDAIYLTLSCVALIIFFGTIFLLSMSLFEENKWIDIIVLALVLSIITGVRSFVTAIQNSARERSTVAIHTGIESVLRVTFTGITIYFIGELASATILAYVIAGLLVTLSQTYYLFSKTRINSKEKSNLFWYRKIVEFAWPFSAYGLFTWSQQVSDRWALKLFATEGEVGQYAVLFQLGYTPVAILLGILVTAMSPILYNKSGDGMDETSNANAQLLARKITYTALSFTFSIFLFLLFSHEFFFKIFVSEDYRELSYLFPWVVLSGGVFATGQTIAVKFLTEIRSNELIIPKLCTSFLGVLFNLVGVFYFGVHGAVAALLLFSTVYLFWMVKIG